MQKDRFHYSLLMEAVQYEFFGVKNSSSGMASAFSNPPYLKKRCKAFLIKIKRRIENTVTNDETLRLLLLNDIDRLDREFGQVSPKNNNDQEIIAYFFRFVAHLLGWAHMDGKFYRTLIFHQTEEQREADLNKSDDPNLKVGFYEVYKRRQLVKQLLDEGNSYAAVARIMGPEVMEAYNRRLQEELERTVWAATGKSWYKTADGKITNNWSGSTIRYWWRTRKANFGLYHQEARTHAQAGAPAKAVAPSGPGQSAEASAA